jgi:hypothetical protein
LQTDRVRRHSEQRLDSRGIHDGRPGRRAGPSVFQSRPEKGQGALAEGNTLIPTLFRSVYAIFQLMEEEAESITELQQEIEMQLNRNARMKCRKSKCNSLSNQGQFLKLKPDRLEKRGVIFPVLVFTQKSLIELARGCVSCCRKGQERRGDPGDEQIHPGVDAGDNQPDHPGGGDRRPG